MSIARQLAKDLPFKEWTSVPIGDIKYVDVGGDEPPTDKHFRYIKLTAGEDGVGGYNEGVLINETLTGSGDEVEITAEISDPDSPRLGEVINLLNSESRYVSPGETPGQIANDQMQQITGFGECDRLGIEAARNFSGAITLTDHSEDAGGADSDATRSATRIEFDSANSPDTRTGTKTNVKHRTRVAFERIR